MIRGDEEDVVVLLAGFVDLANGLVGGSHTLNGGLINTGVADHVGGCEVVHDELELALTDALGHLLAHIGGAHLGVQVVGSYPGGGNHVSLLTRKLLLHAAVEEEGHVGVLLRLRDVALLDLLLAEPLGEHIAHVLGRESNGEGVVGLVLRHGGELDVLGVREVRAGRAVVVAQELRDLANPVGAVVEEEKGVVIY